MHVRMLTRDDAAMYREVRLLALASSPEAFVTTYADYVTRPLDTVGQQLAPTEDLFTIGTFSDTGRLVGTVTLVRDSREKVRHIASVQGMFVVPEARRQGVGRMLFRELLARIKNLDGVEQLKLTVVQDNVAAVALYESFGFETYAIEPRALKTGDRYWDEFNMMMFLDRE